MDDTVTFSRSFVGQPLVLLMGGGGDEWAGPNLFVIAEKDVYFKV